MRPKFIDPKEPIAVIGIGSIFPGAQNTSEYWKNILGKVDSITEVPKDRWDWKLFYSEDRSAPDKTYSKIGGFIRGFKFDPLSLRIPPKIAQQMDSVQQIAVAMTAEALKDSGYDKKPFARERTAVIFGNAMGGLKKEASDLRIYTTIYLDKLASSPAFKKLPKATRELISAESETAIKADLMEINEDSMPGELSNVIAGRVANTFNVNGPNFTVDAACAASLGALAQAVNGLRFQQFDMVITGGVDQMMAPPAYVKFCKIGALSPDGSRPFDAGANGFVMGEGAGAVILKRLSDAVKDGDKIYALIRGIGASSDGRGKGITAPNPKGQKLAMQRAFETVDYGPEDVELLEAHGTSTSVGDLVELQAGQEIFAKAKNGSVALGSIKSQIGHLKAAAGAASLIKTVLALHHKILPPSINFKKPNPGLDWKNSPFYVNTEPREWKTARIRRANVSAFGFGGTNFHVVLEEATPETMKRTPMLSASETAKLEDLRPPKPMPPALGGESFILRGVDAGSIFNRLETLKGDAPASGPLTRLASKYRDSRGGHVLAIAAESAEKLKVKIDFALKMREQGETLWDKPPIPFKPKSIFLGRTKGSASEAPKVAFLFPGQGSQYVDMLKDLAGKYQVVRETFEEADRIMTRLIGEPLTAILWTKGGETPEELAAKQNRIKQTEITQPAVLTADVALLRLLRRLGVEPDVVAGHSLGEYGALVAAGVLSFADALDAVSARGREMANTKVDDNGKMASVAAPVSKIEPVLKEIDGYVICANKNCPIQTVIAGESKAVEEAVARFGKKGIQSQLIEVSHAFHSKIVAPATVPYAKFLERVQPKAPKVPVSSNVTAEYYPNDEAEVRKLMAKQISSPVEWIRQINRMYKDGVRIFVEVGPKRALTAFATSTIGEKEGVVVASSNHPKRGGIHEFNDLISRLTAAGVEVDLGKLDPESNDNIYNREYLDWAMSSGAPETSAAATVVTSAPAATSAMGGTQAAMPQD
ncbi:MAG: type I polyketide synthase, partial [Elusimicrobiota bacterium]